MCRCQTQMPIMPALTPKPRPNPYFHFPRILPLSALSTHAHPSPTPHLSLINLMAKESSLGIFRQTWRNLVLASNLMWRQKIIISH